MDDPAVKLAGEPEPLGGAQESAGQDEVLAVAHAQQRFALHDLAGLKVDDRLAIQLKRVAVQRIADARRPALARDACPPADGDVGVIDGAVITAACLGLIHRDIGEDHQVGPTRLGVLTKRCHPDTDGQRPALADDEAAVLAHGAQQVLQHPLGVLLVGVRERDRELVAAQTRQDVGGAQPVAQQVRGRDQRLVSDPVTERVVDLLEVVQIEHRDNATAAVAPRIGELARELLIEAAAIEEARQRIMIGEVLKPTLKLFAGADVHHLTDRIQRGARP